MPRKAKELTKLAVGALKHPGDKDASVVFLVGGVAGLGLQVTAGGGRSWLQRYISPNGKRRSIGLGPYPEVGLAEARDLAREARRKVREGRDPIDERKAARAELRAAITFTQAVDGWAKAKLHEFKTDKYRMQVIGFLERYAAPMFGDMRVADITSQDVLRALQPIWQTKNSTATRVRGRIENVLDWATAHGHRTGDNPARWKGNLKEMLANPSKVAKAAHHPALQVNDAPRWFAALRQRKGMNFDALRFLALTAARSGEVRGATWDEIDLDNGLWIIPAERMKMDKEHRVPLSAAAQALLVGLDRSEGLVFPAPRGGQLHDMTLSRAMKHLHEADEQGFAGGNRPAVPHGLRSTFRDWVAERTRFDGDMAEIALAHQVGNSVERAYRRGDMVEKRRAMMDAWADHLQGTTAATVVKLHG